VFYTVNFPPEHKYLALFPSVTDGDPAAPALRQQLRDALRARARAGTLAAPTANVPGGDPDLRALLNAARGVPTVPRAAPRPAAARAPPTSARARATRPPAEESDDAQPHMDEDEEEGEAQPTATVLSERKRPRPTAPSKARPVVAAAAPTAPAPAAAAEDEDAFFVDGPAPERRRVREYRLDDGGHRPEQSSRRAWLKQQKCVHMLVCVRVHACACVHVCVYVCVCARHGSQPTCARADCGKEGGRRGRDDRALRAAKGGVIKRQQKEYLRGGDLPEDRRSLLRPAAAAAPPRQHARFNDDDDNNN
jgi:hypothetical protein